MAATTFTTTMTMAKTTTSKYLTNNSFHNSLIPSSSFSSMHLPSINQSICNFQHHQEHHHHYPAMRVIPSQSLTTHLCVLRNYTDITINNRRYANKKQSSSLDGVTTSNVSKIRNEKLHSKIKNIMCSFKKCYLIVMQKATQ